MGQRDKAREIVNERYHFQRVAAAAPADIFAMSDRVIEGVKSRRGSFKKKGTRGNGSAEEVVYELRGPGGLVPIATIILSVTAVDNGSKVGLRIDDFLFQKGSLGMKPTINGAGLLDKLVAGLRTELDLMGRAR